MKPIYNSLSLLLILFFIRAQGVLLEQASMTLDHQKSQEEKEKNLVGEVVICRKGDCSSGIVKRRVKEVHHNLPVFYEDYHGPRRNNPKHH